MTLFRRLLCRLGILDWPCPRCGARSAWEWDWKREMDEGSSPVLQWPWKLTYDFCRVCGETNVRLVNETDQQRGAW